MAEFLMKDLVDKNGLSDRFNVCSSATSSEELGSPVHYGTANVLRRLGIDYSKKRATTLKASDFDKYDYFVCMDDANIRNAKRILGRDDGKIVKLLHFAGQDREVADPYWTGDFSETYNDILEGLNGLLKFLLK